MKFLTVEERLDAELIGPWREIAIELCMTPNDYKLTLTEMFRAEEDAGVQMQWNCTIDPNVINLAFQYNDDDLNTTFTMPDLPSGWGYNAIAGDVIRQREKGKYTGHYTGVLKEGKLNVSLRTPGFGKGGFNQAQFSIYKTLHKEVLQCLANRLH